MLWTGLEKWTHVHVCNGLQRLNGLISPALSKTTDYIRRGNMGENSSR